MEKNVILRTDPKDAAVLSCGSNRVTSLVIANCMHIFGSVPRDCLNLYGNVNLLPTIKLLVLKIF